MDEMVLRAQQWVNATYGSVSGYNRCTENGRTGWETMHSLTRGLQHELGITALSDSFGPTTLARLTAYGSVGPSSDNLNMRTIVEAALYCKGYVGGSVNGDFGNATVAGLMSMQNNMGIALQNRVEPKVFKALLTMDAYVLTGDGTDAVRTCQRWLNGAYYSRGQYFIGPCDGHFSRGVQTSLVQAIQYQMGLTDSQVTGTIGPATRNALRAQAFVDVGSQDSGPAGWVRLFQSAVAFNGYKNRWGDGGGTYTADLASTIRIFQEFCMLPRTGAGDYATWMSLLLSTGDPDRPGTAFDCMLPLNATTIQTVKSNGYRIVGRYLTGGTNKRLTNSEIALVNDSGLSFFPIYQESGNALEFFTYDLGRQAGAAAVAAARGFGIPFGTVIYFAVDFDAQDAEITSAIIPHFTGVRDALAADGNRYAIGVYGCRNVCRRLSSAGLTSRSFVSGMSTGFSGNLGFPLPENWAFDQVKNETLAAGTAGSIEIDKDIVSGRDLGVNSVTRPRDPNDGFYTLLVWLEARAGQWRDQGHRDRSVAELVAQYLRMRNNRFGFTQSDRVFGPLDTGFLSFVEGYAGRPDDSPLRDPYYLWDSDVDHFGASYGAVVNHPLGESTQVNLADFGSWGGDLLSVLGQWAQSGLAPSQARSFAADHLMNRGDNTYLSLSDYIADVDAILIGLLSSQSPSEPLSSLLRQYYSSPTAALLRYSEFFGVRFEGSRDVVRTAAVAMFGNTGDDETGLIRSGFWYQQFGDTGYPTPPAVPEEARNGVAEAFADAVVRFGT